jgi:hypothetical protein
MMGRTPNWDAVERAKISLIRNGNFGRYLINIGKKMTMDSVATYVNWNPALKRLKGLMQRRAKALTEIVLKRSVSFQINLLNRKKSVIMVALRMDGLPSTRKAYIMRKNMRMTYEVRVGILKRRKKEKKRKEIRAM